MKPNTSVLSKIRKWIETQWGSNLGEVRAKIKSMFMLRGEGMGTRMGICRLLSFYMSRVAFTYLLWAENSLRNSRGIGIITFIHLTGENGMISETLKKTKHKQKTQEWQNPEPGRAWHRRGPFLQSHRRKRKWFDCFSFQSVAHFHDMISSGAAGLSNGV